VVAGSKQVVNAEMSARASYQPELVVGW